MELRLVRKSQCRLVRPVVLCLDSLVKSNRDETSLMDGTIPSSPYFFGRFPNST